MDELTTTQGMVALAAGGVAVLALLLALVLAFRLRRLRADQRVVLGAGERDLVDHAAGLEREFGDLHAFVEDVATRLHDRMGEAERRLDGSITYRALVRYDAMGEMSGRQSTTIALLDESQSGVVLSSIHHRDQARLYAKQVANGQSEIDLSPEEAEAVRLAMAGERAPDPRSE